MLKRALVGALFAAAVSVAAGESQQPSRFDLLIRNAHVFDGNGNPWIRADVGVAGDRIQAVGNLAGATAAKTIEEAKAVLHLAVTIVQWVNDGVLTLVAMPSKAGRL